MVESVQALTDYDITVKLPQGSVDGITGLPDFIRNCPLKFSVWTGDHKKRPELELIIRDSEGAITITPTNGRLNVALPPEANTGMNLEYHTSDQYKTKFKVLGGSDYSRVDVWYSR